MPLTDEEMGFAPPAAPSAPKPLSDEEMGFAPLSDAQMGFSALTPIAPVVPVEKEWTGGSRVASRPANWNTSPEPGLRGVNDAGVPAWQSVANVALTEAQARGAGKAEQKAIVDSIQRRAGIGIAPRPVEAFQPTLGLDVPFTNTRIPLAPQNPENIASQYIAQPIVSAGRGMAGYGANAVKLVAPETGNAMAGDLSRNLWTPPSMLNTVGEVAGNMIPTVATALAGGAPAALAGGSVQGAGTVRGEIAEQRAAGQNIGIGKEIAATALGGMVEGVTEAASAGIAGGIGKRLAKEGTKRGLSQVGKAAVGNIATNAVEEGVAQVGYNAIGQLYDPTRTLTEGVGTSMAQGAIGGAMYVPLTLATANAQQQQQAKPATTPQVQPTPVAPIPPQTQQAPAPLTDAEMGMAPMGAPVAAPIEQPSAVGKAADDMQLAEIKDAVLNPQPIEGQGGMTAEEIAPKEQAPAKQPWQMTSAEYAADAQPKGNSEAEYRAYGEKLREHRQQVSRAWAKGEAVPAEIAKALNLPTTPPEPMAAEHAVKASGKHLDLSNAQLEGREGKLSEVLDAPQLFDAAPWLGEYELRVGGASAGGKTINIPAYGDRATLFHEIQHAIQDHEQGTSATRPPSPHDEAYYSDPRELEAHAAVFPELRKAIADGAPIEKQTEIAKRLLRERQSKQPGVLPEPLREKAPLVDQKTASVSDNGGRQSQVSDKEPQPQEQPQANAPAQPVAPSSSSAPDYASMSAAELRKIAKSRGIKAAIKSRIIEQLQAGDQAKVGAKPARYEEGKKLSKEERASVLKTIGDSYIDKKNPKVSKGIDRRGEEMFGYEYSADHMHTSSITGAKIRYYVRLPDGRMAHPSELFPEISESKAADMAIEARGTANKEKAWAASYKGIIDKKEASYVNTYAYSKSNKAQDNISKILAKIESGVAPKPSAPPKEYSVSALRKTVNDWYQSSGHSDADGSHFDEVYSHFGEAGFRYRDKLPEAITHEIGPDEKQLLAQFRKAKPGEAAELEDAATEAGGYAELVDLARHASKTSTKKARQAALKSDDPNVRFAAELLENSEASRRAKGKDPAKRIIATDKLPAWHEFTINGEKFRIIEDEDGNRVAQDGSDFSDIPLSAVDKLPIDKGSLKKSAEPEEVPDFAADTIGGGFEAPAPRIEPKAEVDAPKVAAKAETQLETWIGEGAATNVTHFDRDTRRVVFNRDYAEKHGVRPKTLYRGTSKRYDDVRPSEDGAAGPGIYLAEKREKAEAFAGKNGDVRELYTNIKNPLLITADQRVDAPELNAYARKNGYDGLYIPSEGEWVAFNAENVRFADDFKPKAEPAPAPASAIKKDLFGKAFIDDSGIGKQQDMFAEPTAKPVDTAVAKVKAMRDEYAKEFAEYVHIDGVSKALREDADHLMDAIAFGDMDALRKIAKKYRNRQSKHQPDNVAIYEIGKAIRAYDDAMYKLPSGTKAPMFAPLPARTNAKDLRNAGDPELARIEKKFKDGESATPSMFGEAMSKPTLDAKLTALADAKPTPVETAREEIGKQFGPGAAASADPAFSPELPPTSIKNETTNAEREQRGEEEMATAPTRTFETLVAEAEQTIRDDADAPRKLIAELTASPRALHDSEVALLLHHRRQLNNDLAGELKAFDQARGANDGEGTADHQRKANAISDQLLDLEVVSKEGGTESARGLGARRMMMAEDFTLAAMETRKRIAKGMEPLTDGERAELRESHAKIAELQAKLDALESQDKATPAAMQRVINLFKGEADTAKRKMRGKPRDFEAERKATAEAIGVKVKAGEPLPELGSLIQQLARQFVAEGVRERGTLVSKVHEVVEPLLPGISERQVMDAISGYGDFRHLSKDEVSVALRDLKGQLQQVGKLEDMSAGKAPSKTGMERRVPSDEERRLIQEVQEAKKKLGIQTTDPETQLKSALDTTKTRLRNQIADLEHQIATKVRMVKSDGVSPSDAEVEALKARRDELKAEFDRIFAPDSSAQEAKREKSLTESVAALAKRIADGDIATKSGTPTADSKRVTELKAEHDALSKKLAEMRNTQRTPMTDEQRTKLALASIERHIAEYQRRISQRDFSGKAKGQASSPEMDAARNRLSALRDEYDALKGIDAAAQQAKKEQALAESVAALEKKIAAGDIAPRTGTPTVDGKRIVELKAERDALTKRLFELRNGPKPTAEQLALKLFKSRAKHRIAELNERMERGDYNTARTPQEIRMDTEALALKQEKDKVVAKWQRGLLLDRLRRQSHFRRGLGWAAEGLNTVRAILTSGDVSAVFRQGAFIVLGHPARAAQSVAPMFGAFVSEKAAYRINEEIMSRPRAADYAKAKLYLSPTDSSGSLNKMEENFMSRVAERIPGVKQSQRAYVSFLNKLRADSFDAMANAMDGKDGAASEVQLKALANYVNVATGRGQLGYMEPAGAALSTVFFSPRNLVSRFQLIAGQPLYHGDAKTRVAIGKEYAKFATGLGFLYLLAAYGLGEEIEKDPRSSDFGKIKVGDTRIDPLAGLSQATVLLARMWTGKTKKGSGLIVPIRGEDVPYGQDDTADVLANFVRSKLSPALGTGINIAAGKNAVGEPVTVTSAVADMAIPLALGDVGKTMEANGLTKGAIISTLSLLGMGVQTYATKEVSNVEAEQFKLDQSIKKKRLMAAALTPAEQSDYERIGRLKQAVDDAKANLRSKHGTMADLKAALAKISQADWRRYGELEGNRDAAARE
jgi:hypothetical protein